MNFDDIKKKGEDHLNEHKDEYIEKGKEIAKDKFGGGDKKDENKDDNK
ncbi:MULTISPECIES: hypothetical protein [Staphylococcus]|nr:hypothetical protein [Staphylococcus sp. IVB6181]UXV35136.1 hypothetical protein MUA90_00895 [Staphylococcus sp. IVB6181]